MTRTSENTDNAGPTPNIVVIVADDLRADCIGSVNPLIRTPNIDRITQRGIQFNHCYLMGANTPAVCQPSRVMLMSGRSIFKLPMDYTVRVYDHVQKRDILDAPLPCVPVVPTTIGEAGYDTYYCGKSGNTYHLAESAFDEHVYIDILGNIDNLDDGEELHRRQHFVDPLVSYIGDASRSEKPFLAFYAPPTPHDPLYCEPDFLEYYKGDRLPPLPENAAISHEEFAGFNQDDTNVRPYEVPGVGKLAPPLDLEQWRSVIGQYYAMVSSFDLDVGRILDELERTGAMDNTIVIFTSDNGLALSDHGLIHKSSLYEHEMRLPLAVCGPGFPEGKESDAFVYLSDVFPTLCEMTGTEIPDTVDTESFLPNILDPEKPAREEAIFAYKEEMRGLRDSRYKIILYGNGHLQLFDLENDPFETRNLAGDPAHAARIADMIAKAKQMGKQAGEGVVPNTDKFWRQRFESMADCPLYFWENWRRVTEEK